MRLPKGYERFRFVDDINMSEDQEWSQRVLLAGHALAYVPEAVVRHFGAMQAQEFAVARWSIAQRAGGLDAAAVDALVAPTAPDVIGGRRWMRCAHYLSAGGCWILNRAPVGSATMPESVVATTPPCAIAGAA